MNNQRIKLRLETLILKNKQKINGYRLAMLNTKNGCKRGAYKSIILNLNKSIEKKKEALAYIKANPKTQLDELKSMFRFKY